MRFKLDENLGTRGQAVLEGAGHDVATVVGQKTGVAVLRLPANPGRDAIPDLATVLIQAIARGESLERNLWIVESGRIRIFLNENE